jgi:cell shape-determining protein MreC
MHGVDETMAWYEGAVAGAMRDVQALTPSLDRLRCLMGRVEQMQMLLEKAQHLEQETEALRAENAALRSRLADAR